MNSSCALTHYKRVPNYRDLTARGRCNGTYLDQGLNRVTDTCIPEEEAFQQIAGQDCQTVEGKPKMQVQRFLPHEYMYQMLYSAVILEEFYEIDPKGQLDAGRCRKKLTHHRSWLGRQYDGQHLHQLLYQRSVERPRPVKSGIEYMMFLNRVVSS